MITKKDLSPDIPGEEDTVAGWLARPDTPIVWDIEQLMAQGTDLFIGGTTGIGKSWDTMHLAFQFRLGGKWHNLQCRQLRPIYISLEFTENQMRARIRKLVNSYPTVTDIHFLARKGGNLKLNTTQGRDNLMRLLHEYGGEFGVVMIDPLSLFVNGKLQDMDWNKEIALVLTMIKREFNCSLVINHNSRKKVQIYGHEADNFSADNLKGVSEIIDRADNIVVYISESQPRKNQGKIQRIEVSKWIHAAKTRDAERELKPHRIEWDYTKGMFLPVGCAGW